VADRVLVRTGVLRSDPFGSSYDLVFVSAICHMLSPEENRDLRRRHAALASGGRIALLPGAAEPSKPFSITTPFLNRFNSFRYPARRRLLPCNRVKLLASNR
jgi:hypothetical protein